MRVTPDEVFTEMHKAGLQRLQDVKWAVLEPDGGIAILARDPSPDHLPHPRDERKKAV